MNKIIYYSSRILSIVIVGFFALFILEGFSPEFTWQDSLSHLVITLVVLGATIVAWKKPVIGCWFFIILGLYYLIFISAPQQYWQGILIGGIPLLTGILFLIEATKKTAK
ncbi:hypothetical protein M0R01_03335 [bacterium]|nr:hypothetical protein [bacterium]